MNAQEVLTSLEKKGKPQTAEIYKRHGAGDNVFGTLTSEIGRLKKKIKVDHALAGDLWNSGNAEARMLSLQVSDPAKLTRADAERMLEDAPVRFVWTYLAALIAQSPVAEPVMREWMAAPDDPRRELGYAILAQRLKDDPDSIADADAATLLTTIEKEIHSSPNWGRYMMNSALIAIGVSKPALREKAIAAARRIGKVVVDHGDTHCKTPNAGPYIEKAAARQATKA